MPDGIRLLNAEMIDKRLCTPALEEFSISIVAIREEWLFARGLLFPIMKCHEGFANKLKHPYGFGVDSAQALVVSFAEDFCFESLHRKTLRLSALPIETADHNLSSRPESPSIVVFGCLLLAAAT